MKRIMIAVAAAMMAMAPVTALAAGRSVVIVRRPAFGGYGGYGGYGAYGGPYWGPAYYPAYSNSGEVRIETKLKDADVFINDAYAGTTKDNKNVRLSPGRYTIEVRHGGQTTLSEKVYVVAGKTLHLHSTQ